MARDQPAYLLSRRSFCWVLAGAPVAPRGSFAQRPERVWRVGFLSLSSASESVENTGAFTKALQELGYIEGKNPRASSSPLILRHSASRFRRTYYCARTR